MAELEPRVRGVRVPELAVGDRVDTATGSSAVSMLWFTLALLGGATVVGAVATHAKQALLDDAQAATEGYF